MLNKKGCTIFITELSYLLSLKFLSIQYFDLFFTYSYYLKYTYEICYELENTIINFKNEFFLLQNEQEKRNMEQR